MNVPCQLIWPQNESFFSVDMVVFECQFTFQIRVMKLAAR